MESKCQWKGSEAGGPETLLCDFQLFPFPLLASVVPFKQIKWVLKTVKLFYFFQSDSPKNMYFFNFTGLVGVDSDSPLCIGTAKRHANLSEAKHQPTSTYPPPAPALSPSKQKSENTFLNVWSQISPRTGHTCQQDYVWSQVMNLLLNHHDFAGYSIIYKSQCRIHHFICSKK